MSEPAAVRSEIDRLAELYAIDRRGMDARLDALGPHLERYAEIVLAEDGFEVIAGGAEETTARALARIAKDEGASAAASAFERCAAAAPGRIVGLKLCFGAWAPPTCYVRTRWPIEEGLAFLGELPGVAAAVAPLAEALAPARVLYGLGFSGAGSELVVKTYTLGDVPDNPAIAPGMGKAVGFLSMRVVGEHVSPAWKRYLPDVAWQDIVAPSPRWRRIIDFAASELKYGKAGHFAVTEGEGDAPALKLYVERVGAVATDFGAR